MSEEKKENKIDDVVSYNMGGGFDLEVPDIPLPTAPEPEKEYEDEVEGAYKFAFMGAGQGGSRMAEAFYSLGYRRISVINTAQQDLNTIYKWADDNLMQFNEGKFERMSHGDARNAEKGMYKTKSGKLIEENKTVKDLGVITSRDVSFSEHIDDLVLSSKIKVGLLLRTFKTREVEPMLKMFNSFILRQSLTIF